MSFLHHVLVGNYEMCLHLLDEGVDPNMVFYTGQTPIYFAIRNNDIRCLKLFLDYHANPNMICEEYRGPNWTPLHEIAFHGFQDRDAILELLLKYHADPNIINNFGCTPLHMACIKGHNNIIKLLVSYHADINIKSRDGKSPLHYASQNDRLSSVKLLLESGADIYSLNNDRHIAKDLARNKEIISLIEEYEIPVKEPE